MRISVVGLGPGPAEFVTQAAIARLRLPGARVFVRTRYFPHLERLLDGLAWESFDALYEQAASFEDLQTSMVARLLSAGEEVVLAVPGDGTLGEAILERLKARGASVAVVPGVSLGVAALAAAGLPAADGAQVVEATSLGGTGIHLRIELNPRWPAAVTGVFSPGVAGDLKLALQRIYPPEHPVYLVRHAGLADQQVAATSLAELDRVRALELDHLTNVVLPPVVGYVPTGSSHGLRAIVARLRAPQIGCPWDLEQTHRSLIPYVIEEAYEVVDAIEEEDPASLADELGDVLLQVALHAELADQSDEFDWNDVVRTLSEKLVRRHPHVFGEDAATPGRGVDVVGEDLGRVSGASDVVTEDLGRVSGTTRMVGADLVKVNNASDVVRNWDQLKAAERVHEPPPTSALDGVPKSLPQLKRAAELARKAARAGFDWPTRDGTLDKVREELAELLAADSLEERREELGDLLYILAKLAWQEGVDPEEALRAANRKFTTRFQALEQIARERGWPSLAGRPLEDLNSAWSEAKQRTRDRAVN